ncbi:GreA/GreB family elongation factor [Sulfuriroseicoccus oceanibius]|uniref:GreA/GreB family elongation factor n=1 Tax=Sulfuriroseicoccus oceanibius TaxID=2707525 RepID=A0A6B3L7V3_9BACT|nr:GreA/GreB family elongation factor [Sulfuriroseicoccus oceanibius]QQL43816.1 GreA/GreB family elongation factor [Sulfuriroseicoccus oceanibius]
MNAELEEMIAAGRMTPAAAEVLDKLQPGSFCFHPSWGAGTVKDWNFAALKMGIDFEGKPGHEMGLKFVLKSVEPIAQDHVIGQFVQDPAKVKELAKDDPVAFMGLVLKSYDGKILPDKVEDLVKGRIVEEKSYKRWWENTKKKLREHREFVVPSRRTEVLELRDSELSEAELLLEDFDLAKDSKTKVRAVSEIVKHLSAFESPAEDLAGLVADSGEVASKSAAFDLRGSLELIDARDSLVAAVEGLELPEGAPTFSGVMKAQLDKLPETLTSLPVSSLRGAIRSLPEAFGEQWVEEFLQILPQLGLRAASEVNAFLVKEGHQADLDVFLRRGIGQRDISVDLLAWVCKNRKGTTEHLFDDDLATAALSVMERDHLDEETGTASRLRDMFMEDKDLIPDFVAAMNAGQIKTFARRLMSVPVFDALSRNSLLARIIKLHPEVQELLAGRDEVKRDEPIIVSWESLERRKNEFEDLVQKQIPENTKEIAIARSYGDLRENFEFKAAKQNQAVLMRRKGEMEREISLARGISYDDADTSKVSIGTSVLVEDANGQQQTYHIVGAWDGDPDKNYLSYLSEMGAAFLNLEVGEETEVALSETSEPTLVKVVSITKLQA